MVDIKDPPVETINEIISHLNSAKLEFAIKKIEELLSNYPNSSKLFNILGAIQTTKGDVEKAIKSFETAIKLKPNYAEAYNNLGNAYKSQEKNQQARSCYQKALRINPKLHEAQYNFGVLYQELEDYHNALSNYLKAIEIKPDYSDALNNLGEVLRLTKKFEESITVLKQASTLDPKSAEIRNNIGLTLRDQGKFEEAKNAYMEAISLKEDYSEPFNNLGILLRDQGRFEDAIDSYKKALSINPDFAEAHANISKIKRYKNLDTQLNQMIHLYSKKTLKDSSKCALAFALAKANSDIGNSENCFKYLLEGNSKRKKILGYNIKQDCNLFEIIKIASDKIDKIPPHDLVATKYPIPIFILGMPRSGTTLVEQIISCHSRVSGAGELEFFNQYGLPLAKGSIDANKEDIKNFRLQYLRELNKHSRGKDFVTDKMPLNFRYIALIRKALPESKIINVNRDPAAVCWSNFRLDFTSSKGLGFAYNLEDLVEYHGLYKDLMQFWREKYGYNIYQLDYEELTTNQEKETRNLIKHVGLDWEISCLSPERNKRSVRTASVQQVRKKVYKGSSKEWYKYKKFLNGAFDGL